MVGVSLALFVLLVGRTGIAQEVTETPASSEAPIEPTPTPTVEPTPLPSTPKPSPSTPTPSPQAAVLPSPAVSAVPTPSPTATGVAAQGGPEIERTAPRNTARLVELLQPLTEWGVPLEEALVQGMGRFPVAGLAYYSDDWLAPRYKPSFHLHRGLDIAAEFGTPIRAPTAGVVTAFSFRYPGGIAVTMRGHDSTKYYFAHLMAGAADLQVGQSVEVGTVLGFVGNTGNAAGGIPHLHLEIIQEGTEVPPKPFVDRWLDEAEAAAGDWLEHRRLEIEEARRATPATGDDVSNALLQLVLDPARAALTLLPQVEVSEGGVMVHPPVRMPPSYYP